MQVVKYLETWFHVVAGSSVAQFEAGKFYPLTDETQAHVGRGIAELFEAPPEPSKAESLAQKAQAAADRAAAAAQAARDAADAAAEAQRIADLEVAQEAAETEARRILGEAAAAEANRLADEAAALAAAVAVVPKIPAE
jgi:hypothetical protein